jgi:hypothetical protein
VRVRRDRLRHCEGCAASWDRRARFCGTCGAVLDDTVPDPAVRHDRRRWVRRLGLVGAVLLVSLATVTSGGQLAGQLLAHRPDPVVAMPDVDELVEREPASPEARREALAPFDPDRSSCTPPGCELWRRPVSDWLESPTVGGGNVAYIDSEEVIAVDLHSGEELWRSALPERPAGASSAAGMVGVSSLGGDQRTVAVASHWGVRLLSRTGDLRWETVFETPHGYVGVAAVTDDVVVMIEEELPTPVITEGESSTEVWQASLQRLVAFDARTGQLRWSSDLFPQVFSGASGDLFAVFDGAGVRWLDGPSGRTVSSLPTGDPQDQATWVERVGGMYVVSTWPPEDVGRVWLVDDRDLAVLAELEGGIAAATEVDDLTVVLLVRDRGWGPVELEAVAVEADGTIRWHVPLEPGARSSCCPIAVGLEEGLVRVAGGGGDPVVIDVASGAVLEHDPLASFAGDEGEEVWQLRPGLFARQTDPSTLVIHDRRGRQLTLQGGVWPLYVEGVVTPDTPMLFVGDRELLAVHFPP